MRYLSSIKKFSYYLPSTLIIGHAFTTQAFAQTVSWSGVCVGETDRSRDVATIQGLECLLANILFVAITTIGFAGFVMMVVGSFRYLASGGNSKGLETAKNTMTFSVVGLVVALSSFIILRLIGAFTGIADLGTFVIPTSTP